MVSVPNVTVTMPLAIAAADPPLDPPGVYPYFSGFMQRPQNGLSVVPPRAPSCMFKVPSSTPPAARSRATTVASLCAGAEGAKVPQRVGRPATAMLSFTAKGIPSSGPKDCPATIRASLACASTRALSGSVVTKDRISSSTRQVRSSAASVCSIGENDNGIPVIRHL